MNARLALPLLALTGAMAQQAPQITMQGATYQVRIPGVAAPVLTARVGAQIDGQWIYSTDYPQHRRDGQAVIHTGAAGKPDLVCVLRRAGSRCWGCAHGWRVGR